MNKGLPVKHPKQKKTNPKAGNAGKPRVARLSKAEKPRVAARNSKGITNWLDPTYRMPTPNQPAWDEDPDLPELEGIEEIEAWEIAKMKGNA